MSSGEFNVRFGLELELYSHAEDVVKELNEKGSPSNAPLYVRNFISTLIGKAGVGSKATSEFYPYVGADYSTLSVMPELLLPLRSKQLCGCEVVQHLGCVPYHCECAVFW
jgi:hypothetical protein